MSNTTDKTAKSYWQERQGYNYYQTVKGFLEAITAAGPLGCLLDVGSADTPVVTWGNFKRRVTVDIKPQAPIEGVERITGRWPDVVIPCRPDAVVCCQCIEHQSDAAVKKFTHGLLNAGAKYLIVSVPYMWAASDKRDHPQDPINLVKFIKLMHDKEPDACLIIPDGSVKRVVARFDF